MNPTEPARKLDGVRDQPEPANSTVIQGVVLERAELWRKHDDQTRHVVETPRRAPHPHPPHGLMLNVTDNGPAALAAKSAVIPSDTRVKEQHYAGRGQAQAAALKKLLTWMVRPGQQYNEGQDYARLPDTVTNRAKTDDLRRQEDLTASRPQGQRRALALSRSPQRVHCAELIFA